MKTCLTLMAILLGFAAFAQREEDGKDSLTNGNYVAVTVTDVYAYVNGMSIDAVPAKYARFLVRANGEVIFDYGQNTNKLRNDVLMNKKGLPMVFPNTRITFLLNLFDFNGWELAAVPGTSLQTDWILKKKEADRH